jgi:hypothetical protein
MFGRSESTGKDVCHMGGLLAIGYSLLAIRYWLGYSQVHLPSADVPGDFSVLPTGPIAHSQ